MFRSHALSNRLHPPLAKGPKARHLSFVNPNSPVEKWRLSLIQKTIHPTTLESLYAVLDSRSPILRPWKNHDDNYGSFAVPGPNGLVSPEPVRVQRGRKRRRPDFTTVINGLDMDVKGWDLLYFLDLYVECCGFYALGREDDSPSQPHICEIPKGTTIPPSLRLTTRRRKGRPDWDTRQILGPAFPMSLDCLNQNLEEFMQDSGRVTPLRHWFTPEEDFCKMFPHMIDFMRTEELRLKREGIDDEAIAKGLVSD